MTFNDLLIKNKYSVYRLSKDSGIATSTIFDIVTGKSNILDCSGRILLSLAKCLNITVEDILSLEREPYNHSFENNMPPFLLDSLNKVKRIRRKKDILSDCYYDELNSSINVSEIENLISKEHADYLRKKYLY